MVKGIQSVSGIFYIGDPCYITQLQAYNQWISEFNGEDQDKIQLLNSKNEQVDFAVCGTYYGDGCYKAFGRNQKRDYKPLCVDAGVLGIVPFELWNEEVQSLDKETLQKVLNCGLIVKTNENGTMSLTYEYDGTFIFNIESGHFDKEEDRNYDLFVYDQITVFTGPEEDEEEEYEEDEDIEEDYDEYEYEE